MPRITNTMLVNNYMNNMQRNLNSMSTTQNQMASGKQIQRASENPAIAVKVMQLNAEIDSNKTYNTNINDATNWLNTTDTAMNEMTNIVKRIRTLMVKAGNGTYKEDEMTSIKNEIDEKINQMGEILNTSFNGEYVFGGTKNTSKPVDVKDGKIIYIDKSGNELNTTTDPTGKIKNQINSKVSVGISDGIFVNYNKNAVDILEFKDSEGHDQKASDILSDLSKCLQVASGGASVSLSDGTSITTASAAIDKISGDISKKMNSFTQNILAVRSSVGAMQNRMESAKTNNEDQTYNMTDILTKTDDVDVTEKTMQYAVLQTVYTATLQTSSKVLTNTLMDYLR